MSAYDTLVQMFGPTKQAVVIADQPPGYPDDYAQEPDNPARTVEAETTDWANNQDPGTGNIGGPSYSGMPNVVTERNKPPATFEQSNPDLQYTNAEPYGHASRVKPALAPTIRCRNYILNPPPTGQPVMILSKNSRRIGAMLSHNATTIVIADDPAAMSGLSATSYGDGFVLPPLPFPIEATAELFAACTSGSPVVLSVIEYIDL